MYTGVTSVLSDASNIGFLLSNQRTKETVYYAAPGAIESSAQASARGVVQDLGYTATFPLLLNVAGEPTYFMSLKDASQLVKQYAMVNVAQYQIVATGTTVAECEVNYQKLLTQHGVTNPEVIESAEISGRIADIRSAVIDGNTKVSIRLEGGAQYYVVSVKTSEIAAILGVGDKVTLRAVKGEGALIDACDLKKG
jgi:hypothetical protein